MPREQLLSTIRKALGRTASQPPPPPPEPLIRLRDVPMEERIASFCGALEALNGKSHVATSAEDACAYVTSVLNGRQAVASNAEFLKECGVTAITGVVSGVTDPAQLRELAATMPVGITSAPYALADTGTLVMLFSNEEPRLVSLLPPCHIAVIPRERLLPSLDDLLTLIPTPADRSSAMVFITGPSRTADIEQILVRGVHGPGEVHVVIV